MSRLRKSSAASMYPLIGYQQLLSRIACDVVPFYITFPFTQLKVS